jgi:hypothetical protein
MKEDFMKSKNVIYIFIIVSSVIFIWSSCDDDSTSEPGVTGLEEFKDYESWNVVDRVVGPDPFLATAHGITDNFIRMIYSNTTVVPQPGELFPSGKIFVKELRDLNGNITGPLTVMVKRETVFNPNGNGWEWFMTNDSRDAIVTRGDNATALN